MLKIKKNIAVHITSFLVFCAFFLLYGNFGFCAQSQMIVNYRVNSEPTDRSAISNPSFASIAEHARNVHYYMSQMIFVLTIIEKKSLCKSVEILSEKSSASRTAKILTRSGNYYKDFAINKFVKSIVFANKLFNVNFAGDSVWDLSTEYKSIYGYKCYKATKQNNSKIVAWYCPSINVSDGPLDFYGLPGLILEVTYGNVTYTAYKIEFNKLSNITFNENEVISEDDFTRVKEKYMSDNPIR